LAIPFWKQKKGTKKKEMRVKKKEKWTKNFKKAKKFEESDWPWWQCM